MSADSADPEITALGRYIGMDGLMGHCPDWYYLLRAADRLHCPPWQLLEQSVYWQDIAIKAISAENRGADIKRQREQAR